MRFTFQDELHTSTIRSADHRGLKVTRDATSGKPMKVSGYAIVFNSESESFGTDCSGRDMREIIDPDACTECLAGAPDIRLLADHDSGKVLGRTSAGTLRLKRDEFGVWMEADLPDTSTGRDLATSMERGDIDGMSFGFWPDYDMVDYITDDLKVTQVIKRILKINEVSIVAFPAYPATTASVRSLPFFSKVEKKMNSLRGGLNESKDLSLRLELHKKQSKLWTNI